MENIMLDLETMGTKPGAAIVAIGAVKFDASGVGESFYRVIDLKSCTDVGLRVEASAVDWWMQQSDAARAALKGGANIAIALSEFSLFLSEAGDAKVWGNGASFDNALLSAAYDAVRFPVPWKFYNERCYRTLKNLYPGVPLPTRVGTHHNALDDAMTQALHAVELLNAVRGAS